MTRHFHEHVSSEGGLARRGLHRKSCLTLMLKETVLIGRLRRSVDLEAAIDLPWDVKLANVDDGGRGSASWARDHIERSQPI